jgi:hypothetical protein
LIVLSLQFHSIKNENLLFLRVSFEKLSKITSHHFFSNLSSFVHNTALLSILISFVIHEIDLLSVFVSFIFQEIVLLSIVLQEFITHVFDFVIIHFSELEQEYNQIMRKNTIKVNIIFFI